MRRRESPAAAPGSAGVEADAAAESRRRRGASRPVARRGQPVDAAAGNRPPPRRGPPGAVPGSAGAVAEVALGPGRRRGAGRQRRGPGPGRCHAGGRPVARREKPVDAAVGYRPTDGRRARARPPPRKFYSPNFKKSKNTLAHLCAR